MGGIHRGALRCLTANIFGTCSLIRDFRKREKREYAGSFRPGVGTLKKKIGRGKKPDSIDKREVCKEHPRREEATKNLEG